MKAYAKEEADNHCLDISVSILVILSSPCLLAQQKFAECLLGTKHCSGPSESMNKANEDPVLVRLRPSGGDRERTVDIIIGDKDHGKHSRLREFRNFGVDQVRELTM